MVEVNVAKSGKDVSMESIISELRGGAMLKGGCGIILKPVSSFKSKISTLVVDLELVVG